MSAFVTNGVLGSVIVGSVGLIYAIFSDDGWIVGSILVGFLVYGIWLGLVCTLSGSISGLELVLAIVGIVIISALVIPEIYNKPSKDTAGFGDVVGSTLALALLASLVIIPKFEPYIQFQLKMVRLFAGQMS